MQNGNPYLFIFHVEYSSEGEQSPINRQSDEWLRIQLEGEKAETIVQLYFLTDRNLIKYWFKYVPRRQMLYN